MGVSLGQRGIQLSLADVGRYSTVSVLIDGQRVWSAKTAEAKEFGRPGTLLLAWPDALRARLHGTSEFTVVDSESGETLTRRRLRFGTSAAPILVVDSSGRRLSVNKWGRLSASFDGDAEGDIQERVLASTQRVITAVEDLGRPTFIVGGTLLGAIRSGTFLPNDDDVDLAYLSEHSHPADLVLESYAIERDLRVQGFEVLRHSGAHLQILFRLPNGETDHYVDIFTAFFKDGEFFEPIHMQAELPREAIMPLGTVSFAGVDLPAPADPDAWLAACYGPEWRTPDPSFRFRTPKATRRRFYGWFGEHSLFRSLWLDQYAAAAAGTVQPESEQAHRFAERLAPASLIVDVGCGDGADARYFASLGHRVIAFDFVWPAIERARALATDAGVEVDFRVLNVADRRDILGLTVELVAGGVPVNFFLRHSLDGLVDSDRLTILELMRRTMHQDSLGWLTAFGDSAEGFSPVDPMSWHVPLRDQMRLALENDLHLELLHTETAETPYGERVVLESILRRRGAPTS
ncbi:LicD family protein [Leifsonia flava]|uniref:Methyltransferase domain-containing protein n=1 Tax=Orlajensenia leifsoniae TaxID=2561933 RepID=A0A4Y9QX90_9MICO|nr:LicD family protein [Leifsonia flava]TFV96498.1 methyltransferase domain-containing protein [Leifsonia flava]